MRINIMDINFLAFCYPEAALAYSQYLPYLLSESHEVPTKSLKRTWNKAIIKKLYIASQKYCELKDLTLEQLKLEDFNTISLEVSQSPLNCMKKIREILETKSLAPGAWSQSEDDLLVKTYTMKSEKWGHIADFLNKVIHNGMKIRSGKQCKERWVNHLDSCMKKDKWTEEEDLRLLELHRHLGNKWCEISRILGNRTDSSIKNRLKSLVNKQKQELQFIDRPSPFVSQLMGNIENFRNN